IQFLTRWASVPFSRKTFLLSTTGLLAAILNFVPFKPATTRLSLRRTTPTTATQHLSFASALTTLSTPATATWTDQLATMTMASTAVIPASSRRLVTATVTMPRSEEHTSELQSRE